MGFVRVSAPDVHLRVHGQRVEPLVDGPTHRFSVPPGGRSVMLTSCSGVPALTTDCSEDHRRLGVAISRLVVDGIPVALYALADTTGWHDPEYAGNAVLWRWTHGAAALPHGHHITFDVAVTAASWRQVNSAMQKIA